jgi:SAM-dependent methyltransferase
MKKYFKANQERWDELADHHFTGDFYNVKKFKLGGISITDLERKEVGDVKGKKLLHLQCHFGKDTLSWARLGAVVTGVDFSLKAIKLAKQLNQEINENATFIHSNIFDLKKSDLTPSSFDIVYTSHGTIYWLNDLTKWAEIIAYYLKPGGFFYIADGHPTGSLCDEEDPKDLKIRYPYFYQEKPLKFEEEGSYADVQAPLKHKTEYGWVHDMGDIVNNLINAGLKIEFIHEYPFVSWKSLPFLEEKEDGWWYLPEKYPQLPLTLTIRARK